MQNDRTIRSNHAALSIWIWVGSFVLLLALGCLFSLLGLSPAHLDEFATT
jgi:hypothetical protein